MIVEVKRLIKNHPMAIKVVKNEEKSQLEYHDINQILYFQVTWPKK